MKTSSLRSFLVVLGIAVTLVWQPHASAEITLLADPVTSSATSTFDSNDINWGPSNLYDANPTEADIGTDISAAFGVALGDEHASAGGSLGQGGQQHLVVFDYGVSVSFNGFAFAQRAGNGSAGVDKFESFDIWATDTDPGAASFALPAALGVPQASVPLVGSPNPASDPNVRIFDYHDIGSVLNGRYVIIQMNDDGDAVFNPGGSELQLAFDTAPPDPNLLTSGAIDFGTLAEGDPPASASLMISNAGEDETLMVSAVTPGGPDAASFTVTSFPATLAPGAGGEIVIEFSTAGGVGDYSATLAIATNDPVTPQEIVNLEASVILTVSDDLTMLPDPVASSASTSFGADLPAWGPQNLYDGDPTPDDLFRANPHGADHASAGGSVAGGDHVIVFDYGAPVSFNGLAYAQRAGNGTDGVDKFETIKVWATNTDPGAAEFALPGTLGAAAAEITLGDSVASGVGTNVLNHHLFDQLTGRFVIFQMADDAINPFNPGGHELQLTQSGSVDGLRILSLSFDGATTVTIRWRSRDNINYKLERTTDLMEWEELDDAYPADPGGETSYDDGTVPDDTVRMYYRVSEN